MDAPTPQSWSRRRLLCTLAAAAIFGLLLAGSLLYAVMAAVASASEGGSTSELSAQDLHSSASTIQGEVFRDKVAAAPMEGADRVDYDPHPPALKQLEPLILPLSTDVGPAGVDAGFSRTPEGAIAQLAKIDTFALEPMSLTAARDVHSGWAAAGAEFEQWYIAQSIQAFQGSAGTRDGDPDLFVSVTPVAGQVKGTDGPDWLVACVLHDVTVAYREHIRFGFGHCERMQYADGRWQIAPGDPPVPPPSTWPASQRAVDAGWRPLVEESGQ